MPSDFNQYQPYTGFTVKDPNTGQSQDLGQRYVTKSYLMDVYPNIVPGRTGPGLFFWGGDGNGSSGGAVTVFNGAISPVQIGASTNWKLFHSNSYVSCAIKTNGTLWSWGQNFNGELGQGDTIHRSSPVQVGLLNDWKTISCGGYYGGHVVALKQNGTLWGWGSNFEGWLGLNNTVNYSSPVQIGFSTDWKIVVANKFRSTFAIKNDGTLWSWGNNYDGALGLGLPRTSHKSSPTQIGLLTDWKLISPGKYHCLAIKTDGTLWSWGANWDGQLGLGDSYVSSTLTNNRSSPVQVGSLTDWKFIAGGLYNSFAIRQNGTLWGWGYNVRGALGLGDTINRSSPVQVGSLTNWKYISSSYFALSIKTDGSFWAWGENSNRGLGDNSFVHKSSPIQIGSLTNWKLLVAAPYASFGILDGQI